MGQKKRQPKLIEYLAVIMYAITILDNPGIADDDTRLASQENTIQDCNDNQGDQSNEDERLANH